MRLYFKIFNRTFHWPVILRFRVTCGDGKYGLRFKRHTTTGTMTVTEFMVKYTSSRNDWEWAMIWRPSVTAYWWRKSSDNK